ncbi:hypothetical protein RUM44_000741 [Polyplax serrata]|uniref:Uncharacterized protein n=1 Tax=Polyplax serrata TaxID=468196 RepID=A0ABR1B673_POLSC
MRKNIDAVGAFQGKLRYGVRKHSLWRVLTTLGRVLVIDTGDHLGYVTGKNNNKTIMKFSWKKKKEDGEQEEQQHKPRREVEEQ